MADISYNQLSLNPQPQQCGNFALINHEVKLNCHFVTSLRAHAIKVTQNYYL